MSAAQDGFDDGSATVAAMVAAVCVPVRPPPALQSGWSISQSHSSLPVGGTQAERRRGNASVVVVSGSEVVVAEVVVDVAKVVVAAVEVVGTMVVGVVLVEVVVRETAVVEVAEPRVRGLAVVVDTSLCLTL